MVLASREVVAGRIREARKALELDQHELAAKVGVTQPAISAWEAAEKYPRKETWGALAKALRLAVEDLFFDASPRRRGRVGA